MTTGFPQPPVTQWKVDSFGGIYSQLVNSESELVSALRIASDYGSPTIYGRRRLNDYVGSPIWSDWETLDGDA